MDENPKTPANRSRAPNLDGLDPDARACVEAAAGGPGLDGMTVDAIRQAFAARRRSDQCATPRVSRTDEIDVSLPGRTLPARLYRPEAAGPAHLPTLLYFHGGGWVLGDLDTHDSICRRLSHGSGCAVLSLGYRLAPEHPFPAAVEDAVDAVGWLAAHGHALGLDPGRIAVGGDSAGGNLAAAAALALRGREGPTPRFQLLIYPALDFTMSLPSHAAFGRGYLLDTGFQRWCHDRYLGGADRTDWRVSPLLADDVAGAPPAFVLTASHDPLRDEGEAYAARLVEAGVPVTLHRVPGQVHAFMAMDRVMRVVAPTARLLAQHLALALAE